MSQDVSEAQVNLMTLGLRQALREPGCPFCRLRAQLDEQYLYTLLAESVNSGATRIHFVRSKGLCPEHAWQMQAIEQERWGDGLGVGIIYGSLSGYVVGMLSAYLDVKPAPRVARQARLRERLERLGAVGRWLSRWLLRASSASSLLRQLEPAEPCRVCQLVGDLVDINLDWLVTSLANPEFLVLYNESDGLCLAHLRAALGRARDEETVRRLIELTVRRLGALAADADEYVRKMDWNFRHEPKLAREQVSWVRALAFFSGEAPAQRQAAIYELRKAALLTCHTGSAQVPVGHAPAAAWSDKSGAE